MTGGEGADRSCGIIEEQYITAPLSRGGAYWSSIRRGMTTLAMWHWPDVEPGDLPRLLFLPQLGNFIQNFYNRRVFSN